MEFGGDGEWGCGMEFGGGGEELGKEQEETMIKVHYKDSSKEFLKMLH